MNAPKKPARSAAKSPAKTPATKKPAGAKTSPKKAPEESRAPAPEVPAVRAPAAVESAPPVVPAVNEASEVREASDEGDEGDEGALPETADARAAPGAPEASERREETVPENRAGSRLDRVLCELFPELSRARAKAMIDDGQVRVNGRRARKGDPLAAGSVVALLSAPPPRDFSPVAQADLEVTVLHADARVAVFDKPAGMPTHPLKPDEKGTLANAVVAKFPQTATVGFAKREPGLLQRLDSETSGVLLVALDKEAFELLREASKAGTLRKRYVALVEGVVESDGRVEYPLVPHRKDPKRVEAVTPNVRLRAGTRTFDAVTRYAPRKVLRVGEAGTPYTLVDVEVASAFRHQVRVHLATAGHPLAGDALYRGPSLQESHGLERHFLHAAGITFPHPDTGAMVTIESPLPKDLADVLRALEKDSGETK